ADGSEDRKGKPSATGTSQAQEETPAEAAVEEQHASVAPPLGLQVAQEHCARARAHLEERKALLAAEELNKAIAAAPEYPKSYRLLGMANMLLGREESAVQAFEKFVDLDPQHRDVTKVKVIISDFYKRNPAKVDPE
ncbi:hypothetical protein ACFL6C_14250, partial [Myxococcota bacterium]